MTARTRGVVLALGLLAAQAEVQADAVCRAQLSAAQTTRYAMAVQACATTAAGPRAPAAAPGQPPESAHLRLFGHPGLVATAHVVPLPRPVHALPALHPWPEAPPLPAAAPARTVQRPSRALQLAPHIDDAARRHDIDPLLLHAIAHVESRHNPAAVSPAGARGVMQVMPATGARFGVARPAALHEVRTNIEVSATYLKLLQRRFGNQLQLVLAAYNAGEGAVERHGRRIPQNGETPGYVQQVLAEYRALSSAARQRSVAGMP
ncbi:lytic transglycosylase domain-containing protein [Rubrivivax sp. RP6-9]|uniref:lytic transglycosylase domain-containing protein n=1 Tax=Rubrivivax sp. RP6-9 TaxID=3415750 RepID=UPI003CC603E3